MLTNPRTRTPRSALDVGGSTQIVPEALGTPESQTIQAYSIESVPGPALNFGLLGNTFTSGVQVRSQSARKSEPRKLSRSNATTYLARVIDLTTNSCASLYGGLNSATSASSVVTDRKSPITTSQLGI